MSPSPVTIKVTFLRVTTAGLLVEVDDFEVWIPRAIVEYDGLLDHCEPREVIEITLPHDAAYARGLV